MSAQERILVPIWLRRVSSAALLLFTQNLWSADARVTFQAFPREPAAGENVRWTLAVTNPGPVALWVFSRITFPAPSVFRFTSLPAGCDPLTPETGHQVSCNLGKLAAGAGVVLNFEGTTIDLGWSAVAGLVWDETSAIWAYPSAAIEVGPGKGILGLEPLPGGEGSGEAHMRVNRTAGTTGNITVDYVTSPRSAAGNDYESRSGTLLFTNGEYRKLLQIPVSRDKERECNETFAVRLTNATGGAVIHPDLQSRSVRIIDDDLAPRGTVQSVTSYPGQPTTTIEFGGTFQSMTPDGTTFLFASRSRELAAGDLNEQDDLFVHNSILSRSTLVSANRVGTGSGNGPSSTGRLSADSRWVAFISLATDLVTNQVSGMSDLYARDLLSGTTQLVSVNTNGTGGNDIPQSFLISSNGDWVVWESAATDLVTGVRRRLVSIYARHLPTGVTRLVNPRYTGDDSANIDCFLRGLSDDGRSVLFVSGAIDLVPGDTNARRDVFLRDLVSSTTTSVTKDFAGVSFVEALQISADARFALFNFNQNVYLRDLTLATNYWIYRVDEPQQAGLCSMSSNGRYVAFVGSASNQLVEVAPATWGVFVRDVAAGTTRFASERCVGGVPTTSAFEARYGLPRISDDGRYVVFTTLDQELVYGAPNGSQVALRRDLLTRTTELLSVNYHLSGPAARGNFNQLELSRDGRTAGFFSDSSGLMPQDNNASGDVFVWREHPPGPNAELRTFLSVLSYQTNLVFLQADVDNVGPEPATGVVVTFSLPAGLEPLSATTVGGACTLQAGAVICEYDEFAAGGGATVQLQVRSVTTDTAQVSVRAVAAQHDPLPSNNERSVLVYPANGQPTSGVQAFLSTNPQFVPVGQPATITLTLTNSGAKPEVVNAEITFSPQLELLSMPPPWICQTVCQFGSIPAHSSVSFSWQVRSFEQGRWHMTVFAWGTFGILDPYPQATVTVTEGPLADLRLSMRELASPTNLVILAVGVTNFGPTQATGVMVTNTFSFGIQPLAGTASTGSYRVQGAMLIWELGELVAGAGSELQLVASSTLQAPGTVAANVQGLELDPAAANNSNQLIIQPGTAVAMPPSDGLSIARYERLLVVRWHSLPAEFVLEQTTSLADPVRWEPSVVAGDDGVLRTWAGANDLPLRFFRLRLP